MEKKEGFFACSYYFLFVFIVLGCTILRSATQINHVNRAHVLIGWQLSTQVCQSFTRQIQICEHEKVGEKVGENRDKFYSTPTVCKRVCRLLLCRSHTPNWVCQHEFANLSLPCEGRLMCFLASFSLVENSIRSPPFKNVFLVFWEIWRIWSSQFRIKQTATSSEQIFIRKSREVRTVIRILRGNICSVSAFYLQ